MKKYLIKVYKKNNDFVATWEDAEFFSFKQIINGGLGQLQFDLARSFTNYGEGVDVKLNYEVRVYCVDNQTDSSGALIYSGYISGYEPYIDGKNEGIKVKCLGYYTKLKSSWFKSANSNIISYSSIDTANVAKWVIENYQNAVGMPAGHGFESKISWDADSIPETSGNNMTYSFSLNTHADAIEKARGFSPGDWWYFIGADNKLQFKSKPSSPTHIFQFGKDFKKISVFKNMENIKNMIHFWNGIADGGGGQVKDKKWSLTSVQEYDPMFESKTDGRVTTSATATGYMNAFLSENENPEVKIEIEILDNNGDANKGYDIESIQVGHTCLLRGFDATTSDLFYENMTIVGLTYEPNKVLLELESLQTSLGREMRETNSRLNNYINEGATSVV